MPSLCTPLWLCPLPLQIFKKEDFRELAYHIVRGNQLMVRRSDASTVMPVLNVFKVRANQTRRDGGKKENVWVLVSVP